MKAQRKRRSGFTLIEVLLVLLILGMLATVAIVGYSGIRENARIDATRLKLKQIEQALELYNSTIGHYPSEAEGGLKALTTKPTFDEEAIGAKWYPFVPEEPKDAWEQPFNYELQDTTANTGGTAPTKPFHIWSNGPDKQSGTADDIKNWSDETATK